MSHTSSSRSRRVAFLGVAFVFGSAITGFANSGADVALADEHANFAVGQKYEVASIELAHKSKFAGQIRTEKLWPAPVGYRQPRSSDVTADAGANSQLSSSETEEQRLDRELKEKLLICRGC